MDGIFPLSTNTDLDALAVLRAYKYQPTLEKRHALLKSGLQVAPIFLKKNQRIEALMFVYFLAQLVCALIERQLRNAMRQRGLSHIQILPEDRPSRLRPPSNSFVSSALALDISCSPKMASSWRLSPTR